MAEPSPSDLARALAARRRRQHKRCVICGADFEGLARRLYCSPNCASKAYWDRKRPELNAKRRDRYRQTKAIEG